MPVEAINYMMKTALFKTLRENGIHIDISDELNDSITNMLTIPVKKQVVIDDGMKETIRLFSYFVSLLLYLSSDEPDIDRVEQELPKRPPLQRTKKGLILEPPIKPRIWNVGNSIATALKLWAKEPTGAEHNSPRPHIRRAHWHGFWRGERNSQERVFFYKWLPPIIVNTENKA